MSHSCWLCVGPWHLRFEASEGDIDLMANLSPSPDLDTVLDSLKVPSDFSRHDRITEDDVLARLDEWKGETHLGLVQLREIALTGNLTLRQQAQVVSTAAFFDGEGTWVTARSLGVSQGEHCAHFCPRHC
jgi:hypothetical protein